MSKLSSIFAKRFLFTYEAELNAKIFKIMLKLNMWLLVLSINLCLAQSGNVEIPTSNVAKATVAQDNKSAQGISSSTTEYVVVISEKTLTKIQLEKARKDADNENMDQEKNNPKTEAPQNSNWPNEYDKVLKRIDVDLESSVRTGFYILMTISAGALLFVSWKIYKLRLSRAERKYGVQGDRTTQELAPLPISMEDPDSDEEDQTIFDAHRQIRIF